MKKQLVPITYSFFGVYVLAVQENSPAEKVGVNAALVRYAGEWTALQENFAPEEQVMMDFQRRTDRSAYAVRLVWNEEVEA